MDTSHSRSRPSVIVRAPILLVMLLLALVPLSQADADFTSTPVPIQVSVGPSCSITSPASIAFGNFTGTVKAANASAVSVTCTNAAPWTITADAGLNASHAVGATRAMNNGTTYLSYELYTNVGMTTVWNGTNTIAGTGTGSAQAQTVYAAIPAQIVPAAASYADTVVATVAF